MRVDRVLLGSGNPHKAEEIEAVLAACAEAGGERAPTVVPLDHVLPEAEEPVEDGDTFRANAEKKARHYAARAGMPALADDSGLAVDALEGAPGVVSARYAGASGTREQRDRANNRRLLSELAGVAKSRRSARFVCVMVLAVPDDAGAGTRVEAVGEGTVEGCVLTPAETADPDRPELGRGEGGFGYDPLFELPDGRTTAELTPAEKNAISHRGRAIRALWEAWSEKS